MVRLKTYDATGVAPNGRLFAGDLNLLQDTVAALSDYTQNLAVLSIAIGDSSLSISKFGTGELQVSNLMRVLGIFRAASGFVSGSYTTTLRDAIASPPYGLTILNSTTNQYEWNSGTPSVPVWTALGGGSLTVGLDGAKGAATALNKNKLYFSTDINGGTLYGSTGSVWQKLAPGLTETPTIPAGTITSAMILDGTITDADHAADTLTARVIAPDAITASELANNAVDNAAIAANAVDRGKIAAAAIRGSSGGLGNTFEIASNTISAADIHGSLFPSGSAAPGTEALRALGTTGATAAAGNDARLSDQRVPVDNSVTSAKILDGTIVDADISGAAAIALAKLADTIMSAVASGHHTESGTVSGTEAGSGFSTAVTFARAFSSPPRVLIQHINDATNWFPTSITATGFTANGSGTVGAHTAHWFAEGA